jgi:hypothetical protein
LDARFPPPLAGRVAMHSCLSSQIRMNGFTRTHHPQSPNIGRNERSRTLPSHNTTAHPLTSLLEHETTRFVFAPRCCSLALLRWPWRTASVVPMMAGQAAIAVMIPKTISKIGEEDACRGDVLSDCKRRMDRQGPGPGGKA